MAHHINISVAFEYLAKVAAWEAMDLSIAGRRSGFPDPPATFLGTSTPIPDLGGFTPIADEVLLRLSSLHQEDRKKGGSEILYSALSADLIECVETIAKLSFEDMPIPESLSQVLVAPTWREAKQRALNPWEMRAEFMQLEESNAALLAFLNRWGIWELSSILQAVPTSKRRAGYGPLGSGPLCVSPYNVWKRRRTWREGMLSSADPWLKNRASMGTMHRRSRYPYWGVTDGTCAEAIETTITLDHLRDVRNRLCARPDCGNIFTLESNHQRVYCQQYCGHLMSVRRNRGTAKRPWKRTK